LPPIIGITATLKEDVDAVAERPLGRFVRADLDYVDGVAGAGGVPVVLPPTGEETAAEAVIRSLDGLLLSGGSDLDPGYYGEEPVPELGVTLPERDAFEMTLVGLALRRGMPVFGICRGMQVLNVALGGTLYQDLPSQWERDVLKHRQDTPKWQPTHEVRVEDGSYVAGVMDRRVVKVNSYHHQGVKDLARGLLATGRSSDGVVEAVEAVDVSERWLLGVQWHAEAMRGAGPQQESLFEAHVLAAKRHALRGAAA
jgi:putative glutamine amidotransferase